MIFITNAGTALIIAKIEKQRGYWNKYLLIFSAICTLALFILFTIENTEIPHKKPKYEPIQEQLYRQVV